MSRFSKRLQVQERLTRQIGEALWERFRGVCGHVVVVVDCRHLCMIARGVQQHSSATVTQGVWGVGGEGGERVGWVRGLVGRMR